MQHVPFQSGDVCLIVPVSVRAIVAYLYMYVAIC